MKYNNFIYFFHKSVIFWSLGLCSTCSHLIRPSAETLILGSCPFSPLPTTSEYVSFSEFPISVGSWSKTEPVSSIQYQWQWQWQCCYCLHICIFSFWGADRPIDPPTHRPHRTSGCRNENNNASHYTCQKAGASCKDTSDEQDGASPYNALFETNMKIMWADSEEGRVGDCVVGSLPFHKQGHRCTV